MSIGIAVKVTIRYAFTAWIGTTLLYFYFTLLYVGYAVAQLVETLRYKPKGRRFDSRWGH
jgi:hypothetical protein